jgi:hypothetical protein
MSNVVTVYSREPIRELVAYSGPFVMKTEAEIARAYRDFRGGKFGDIPCLARLSTVERENQPAHVDVEHSGVPGVECLRRTLDHVLGTGPRARLNRTPTWSID